MSLDLLYGAGAAEAFSAALAAAALSEGINPDGSVHVAFTLASGASGSQDCWPHRIHYSGLQGALQHPGGVLEALIVSLLDLYTGWGVQVITAEALDASSAAILERVGFEPVRGSLSATVNGRMREYRDWCAAGRHAGEEPSWR